MKIRRAFAYIAFAFFLLSQQIGMTHAILHIASDAKANSFKKKQLPSEMQCEQCLAFAALGAGLIDTSPGPVLPSMPTDVVITSFVVSLLPAALRAFDSRAPPVLI